MRIVILRNKSHGEFGSVSTACHLASFRSDPSKQLEIYFLPHAPRNRLSFDAGTKEYVLHSVQTSMNSKGLWR